MNKYDGEKASRDIADARADGAEFIICYMHWGHKHEYETEVCDDQYKIADHLANSGVDLILGSHTHSLQKFGNITTKDGKNVPVAYSLSNFSTSDEINDTSHFTVIAAFTLKKENGKVIIKDVGYIPCYNFMAIRGMANVIIPCDTVTDEPEVKNKLAEASKYIKNIIGDTAPLRFSDHFDTR